jgi:hypothetical protein
VGLEGSVKSPNTEFNKPDANFAALLQSAVEEPANITTGYSKFWNYSIGNQMLALGQCTSRGIEPGPISTFVGWKVHGRIVKKGEKAIVLCMPLTKKATTINDDGQDANRKETITFTRFIYKPKWFVLSQTDGVEYKVEPVPGFAFDRALQSLNIERVKFDQIDGNCHGNAKGRTVAVSSIVPHPERTLLHEIAHVVLGHTMKTEMTDGLERIPRTIGEFEAEATAMLCCAALGLGGLEESRGYIQHWYNSKTIPETSARRIFHATDAVLKAGRVKSNE